MWWQYVLFPMASGKDSGCDSVSWIKRLSPDTSSAESLRRSWGELTHVARRSSAWESFLGEASSSSSSAPSCYLGLWFVAAFGLWTSFLK